MTASTRHITDPLEKDRSDVTRDWRRLHNEELYDPYYSPNIAWVITSRWMRWAGHVARMGKRRDACRVVGG